MGVQKNEQERRKEVQISMGTAIAIISLVFLCTISLILSVFHSIDIRRLEDEISQIKRDKFNEMLKRQ